MKVSKDQVFNLMDTNGRRNDVINALQGYLMILDNLLNEKNLTWENFPKSSAQFQFYKQAIELSPDVFKNHPKYDAFMMCISDGNNQEFRYALENNDFRTVIQSLNKYKSLIDELDKNIEARARHYTSNLVKLGFTNEKREISSVGRNILYPRTVKKDKLEELIPIDSINVIYLRQLLKLKIFSTNKKDFYSPFFFALWLLLKKKRVDENIFLEMVQGINPYSINLDIDELVENYSIDTIIPNYTFKIQEEFELTQRLNDEIIKAAFRNQKSLKISDIYLQYYHILYDFSENPNEDNLKKLILFYNENKDVIKKAFGCGKNIFHLRPTKTIDVAEFLEQNKKIFDGNLNKNLYLDFKKSKLVDSIKEYSDTTKRIFKATGIIDFNNGFVELTHKELLEEILDVEYLYGNIFGSIENNIEHNTLSKYEKSLDGFFCSSVSFIEIFHYSEASVDDKLNSVRNKFGNASLKDITKILTDKRNQEFVKFIDNAYPLDKVKNILNLFNDRSNDAKIKELVCPDSSVPTIYEYMVGIAWFYFSGKRINLLQSFNLTLSANFEPLMHAGGGQGDIVIYEEDKVVMLEATLMNANSQKRGEWEPVLRHSANLKIEEESNNTGRDVTTFFIADTFDYNTINIWKAVSLVSLQSSVDKEKFTDNVIIMPISTNELVSLMDKSYDYDKIISKVRYLFNENRISFDLEWRKKFIDKIV